MQVLKLTKALPDPSHQVHASVLLQELIDGTASTKHFTLGWLIGNLPERSFGVIILFLGLFSLLPFISYASGVLILILMLQLILGYRSPVFPRWLLLRQMSSRYLVRLDRHVVPALKHLERIVRPRWSDFLRRAQRISAIIVLLLTILSLLAPLPFANIPVAMVTILMALAYIEHDGLLLSVTIFTALAMLLIVSAAVFYVS